MAALNGPIINVKKAGELIFLPLITGKKLTTLGEINKKSHCKQSQNWLSGQNTRIRQQKQSSSNPKGIAL